MKDTDMLDWILDGIEELEIRDLNHRNIRIIDSKTYIEVNADSQRFIDLMFLMKYSN